MTLLLERFNKFWIIYPARNGIKLGKPEAKNKFFRLNDKDSLLIIQATINYANSKDVKAGIGIRDAHRFIRDGKGIERWREYIVYTQIRNPTQPPRNSYSTPEQRAKDADDLRTGKTLSFQEVARRLMVDAKKRND